MNDDDALEYVRSTGEPTDPVKMYNAYKAGWEQGSKDKGFPFLFAGMGFGLILSILFQLLFK